MMQLPTLQLPYVYRMMDTTPNPRSIADGMVRGAKVALSQVS